MGILEKIIDRSETKFAVTTTAGEIVSSATTVIAITSSETAENYSELPQKPASAMPCPICRSQKLWFDRYGGGPHCLACKPPPSKTFVKQTRELVATAAGVFAWADELPSHQPTEQELDEEFNRTHRSYVTPGGRFVIERRDYKPIFGRQAT